METRFSKAGATEFYGGATHAFSAEYNLLNDCRAPAQSREKTRRKNLPVVKSRRELRLNASAKPHVN